MATEKASSTGGMDENVIPGTVHLVDLEHVMHAEHAGRGSDIVLVPTPSNDVDDPLNWTPRRKALAASCIVVYTVTVGIASAAIYSVLEPISEDTGLALADLNAGTGYMFLLFGWGCLFFQPLALRYGKRPVFLFSMISTLAIMVWTPYTNTRGQYFASKILQGFFGAPIESLIEISVADVWFQHERGTYIGLYAFSLAGSSYFAPIIAGFIADGQGWQWVFFWCAIFLAVGFVYNFFFMEETNYDRIHPKLSKRLNGVRTSSEKIENGTPLKHEKPERDSLPTPETEDDAALQERRSIERPAGKSYLQKLSLAPQRRPLSFWKMVPRPLLLLTFPVIAWAGFSYGTSLIWFNVLNGTASLVLSAPPYNFTPSIVGVTYASPLVGVCLASLVIGKASDWILVKLARRNAGIVEPEYRLWLFAVSALLTPFALILWGVGAAHGVHWFGLVFSMGVTAAVNCIGIQLSVLYAIDSYKELAGEALVTVILVRNTMSFAVNYGLTPWVTGMGLQNAFLVAAFVGMAQCLTFLVFVRWGKGMRRGSRERYYRYVREGREIGTVE